MIDYWTGKPRSGKTYGAVKGIYDVFMNPKCKSFDDSHILYTNINGFNHSRLNEEMLDFPVFSDNNRDGYIYKRSASLDWDYLYPHLVKIMKFGEQRDDDLIEYLKSNRLYKIHFVIDECHKYFSKSDPVLIWWLGYHGHMSHKITLITQNLKKVHTIYKDDCESFNCAQPKSKSINKNQLRYKEFASDSQDQSQLVRKYSLLMKQNIHSLYKSGDVHNPKSTSLPMLISVFLMFLFCIFAFKMLFFKLGFDTDAVSNDNLAAHSSGKNYSSGQIGLDTNVSILSSDLSILFVRCSSTGCWNTNEKYNHYEYSLDYVNKMMYIYGKLLTKFNRHNYNSIKHYKLSSKTTLISSYITYAYAIDKTTSKKLFPDFYIELTKDVESSSSFGNDREVFTSPLDGEAVIGEV